MDTFSHCPTCKAVKLTFGSEHKCPPRFEVMDPDWDGQRWEPVYAADPWNAAEAFCDQQNRKDQSDYTHGAYVLFVRDSLGAVRAYEVCVEVVRVYAAKCLEDCVCTEIDGEPLWERKSHAEVSR